MKCQVSVIILGCDPKSFSILDNLVDTYSLLFFRSRATALVIVNVDYIVLAKTRIDYDTFYTTLIVCCILNL